MKAYVLIIILGFLLCRCNVEKDKNTNCIFPKINNIANSEIMNFFNYQNSSDSCEVDFNFNYWLAYENGSPVFKIKGKIKKENKKIIIKDDNQPEFILFSFEKNDSININGYFYHGNPDNNKFVKKQRNYFLINEGSFYNTSIEDTIHKLRFKAFGTKETGIDLVFLVGLETGPIGCYDGEKYNNEEYYVSFIGSVDTSKLVRSVLK